jgi:protein kinase-like protein
MAGGRTESRGLSAMALNRYTLGAERSRGATALVYEARTEDGEHVVVKLLSRAFLDDPATRARVASDLETATRVAHPNVERVHGAGSEDGFVWVDAELIEGTTLRALVDERGAMPPARACELVLDVLAALRAAHAHGLLHRNLSPATVVIAHDGTPKVVDFGLVADRAAGSPWRAIDGAAAYASPERARGEQLDARADVYSVGVLLHELITGGAAARNNGATVPAYVDELVQWTTSVERDARPRSADEFATVLQLAASREFGADWRARPAPAPSIAEPVAAAQTEEDAAPSAVDSRAQRLRERRRRHTRVRVAVVAGIAVAALAVSAAAFALRQGSTQSPSLRAPDATTLPSGSFALGHADVAGTASPSDDQPAPGSSAATTVPTAAAAAPFNGDACSLVTAAEAGNVFGERVVVTPTPDAPNDCSYLGDPGIVGELTVDRGMTDLPAADADFERLVNGMAGRQQPVNGLGERAVLVGEPGAAVLLVLQHGWIVQIVAMTDTDVSAREQQLARLAVARLR